MIKVSRLPNKITPNCLRIARPGELIQLDNGDVVAVVKCSDNCAKGCYFAITTTNGDYICKGRTIIENMVPDADVYIRPEKFRNCFLRKGRQFAKVGSVKEGV